MLDREDRFYSPSGGIYPGGPSIWHVIDWDQRRLVSVEMDEEQESPDEAFRCLLKHIDTLPPDVYLIHLSPEGDVISTSNDPKDDQTICVFRLPIDTAELPDGIQTISRAELEEIGRLGPNVDLVVYPKSTKPNEKFVFKYCFLFQHISVNWHEMCLWSRLKHPNIVPFDIVVDELEGGLVGFTTQYISGGTLEENKTRIFKLKWLNQLLQVVDELNLHLGIAHQEIAPRNLLIDESTDTLMLFDFNFSGRIGKPGYSEPRNDVKGAVFTIHEDQDLSAIENMAWIKHPDVLLDHPVSTFRKVLDEWCERRRKGDEVTMDTRPSSFLDWPPLPDPPLTEVIMDRGPGLEPLKEMEKRYDWRRPELLQEGKTVLNWQRPPQRWPEKQQAGEVLRNGEAKSIHEKA
ncbi:hypothetical protein K4F52_006948 [Lecanicillium sp. MT-2017a]|nr:hypothetical protein K4F52_006948 [Lecanicillium sp. MT-2017a]